MFLPVKADFDLPRFPVVTVMVCLVCLGVFMKQSSDWQEFEESIIKFCSADLSHIEKIVYERVAASAGTDSCMEIMYTITNDADRSESEVIKDLVKDIKPLSGYNKNQTRDYVTSMMEDKVRLYKRAVPDDPDHGLAYYTGSWNPITMLTSSFAHGSWGHIIFNLIFFFAFAATVESLIGPFKYLIFFVVDSFFIGVIGSAVAGAAGQHYWTLGLSGVVMGMMGLFAYLLPKAKIKCFYFFIIIFGSVAIPGWILAAWYIGGDIYELFANDDHGVVNVLAHVTGGIGGYLFGAAFLGEVRKDARHLQGDLDRNQFEERFR